VAKPCALVDLKAFTLIELLVLMGIIVLIISVLLPSLAYQKRHARQRACINNLKWIGVAFRTWPWDWTPAQMSVKDGGAKEQLEMGRAFFAFLVMSNELSTPNILVCPTDDGKVTATTFNALSNTNVSYFVSADARDVYPQMFFAGDRNLAVRGKALGPGLFVITTNDTALSWTKSLHNGRGNIGLADGSVQSLSSAKLALAAAQQSCETNCLAIP
jgi:prepilin-type processing-associated H-X9-DG protein